MEVKRKYKSIAYSGGTSTTHIPVVVYGDKDKQPPKEQKEETKTSNKK